MNRDNPYEDDDTLPLGTVTLSQDDKVCLVITVTPRDNVEITSTTLPREKAENVCTQLIEDIGYLDDTHVTIDGEAYTLKFLEDGCVEEICPERLQEISDILFDAERTYTEKRNAFFAKWKGRHLELWNEFVRDIPEDINYECEEAGDFTYYQGDDEWLRIASGIDYDTRNGGHKVTFNTCDGNGSWDTAGEYDDESIKDICGGDFLFDYWSHCNFDEHFLGLVRYHCFCAKTGTDPLEEWSLYAKTKDDLKAARDNLAYLKK